MQESSRDNTLTNIIIPASHILRLGRSRYAVLLPGDVGRRVTQAIRNLAMAFRKTYVPFYPYTASKDAVIRAAEAPFLRISRVIHRVKDGRERGRAAFSDRLDSRYTEVQRGTGVVGVRFAGSSVSEHGSSRLVCVLHEAHPPSSTGWDVGHADPVERPL